MKMHEKAKKWRKRMGLTIDQLEEKSGFSRSSIIDFERGCRRPPSCEPISDFVWQRYRMICAGIEYETTKGRAFDW